MTPKERGVAIKHVRRIYENYVIGSVKWPSATKMARELLKIGDKFLLHDVAVAGS